MSPRAMSCSSTQWPILVKHFVIDVCFYISLLPSGFVLCTTFSFSLLIIKIAFDSDSKLKRGRTSKVLLCLKFQEHDLTKDCSTPWKEYKKWRCGVSNPVPLACKASALPFELHPHLIFKQRKHILTIRKDPVAELHLFVSKGFHKYFFSANCKMQKLEKERRAKYRGPNKKTHIGVGIVCLIVTSQSSFSIIEHLNLGSKNTVSYKLFIVKSWSLS